MKTIIIAATFFAMLGIAHAQKGSEGLFDNTRYQMKDGHQITLREDGRVEYDGRFLFDRFKSKLETDNYIPFVLTIVGEKGQKIQAHAALELQESKVNNKIWFTIYEGPLGAMRQSYIIVARGDQARI